MCKEEVQQNFPVLAAELREQRANSNVLLIALLRKEEKEEEIGEWQEGVHRCAKKRFSISFLSWPLSCGSRGRTLMFCSVAVLGRKRRKKKQKSSRRV